MAKKTAEAADEPTWNEATAELQTILDALDSEQLDIDSVAASVERAAELVTICRGKLRNARFRVDQALATLDDPDDRSDPDDPADPDDPDDPDNRDD